MCFLYVLRGIVCMNLPLFDHLYLSFVLSQHERPPITGPIAMHKVIIGGYRAQ